MKKLLLACTLALVAAPALAMSSGAYDVPQGSTPVARADFDALTARYRCSQGWLGTRPQYSTAKKNQTQNYDTAALAFQRDNKERFDLHGGLVVKTIADLRIPC